MRFMVCQNILGWRGLGALGGLLVALVSFLTLVPLLGLASRVGTRPELNGLARALLTVTVLGLTLGEVAMDRVILAPGAWFGVASALLLSVLAVIDLRIAEGGAVDNLMQNGDAERGTRPHI